MTRVRGVQPKAKKLKEYADSKTSVFGQSDTTLVTLQIQVLAKAERREDFGQQQTVK